MDHYYAGLGQKWTYYAVKSSQGVSELPQKWNENNSSSWTNSNAILYDQSRDTDTDILIETAARFYLEFHTMLC